MTIEGVRRLAARARRRPIRQLVARALDELRHELRWPWTRLRPYLLTDAALLRRSGATSLDAWWDRLARGPFFLAAGDRASWVHAYDQVFPEGRSRLLARAERALEHEFDLLGSGPIRLPGALPWHEDFKTSHRWPRRFHRHVGCVLLDKPCDVKVPWELSRCQHFVLLGQAWWLTGDERFAGEVVAQITDWLTSNPWGYGVNWTCTMEVALRAVSWIWAFHFLSASAAFADPAFRRRFLRALVLHGEFIAANIEHSDTPGNHYLLDAVGLVFLGTFFGGSPAGRAWLAQGRAMVCAEIASQTSPDGVDFECALSYHRLVLEAFATSFLLLERAGDAVPPDAWARLERMMAFTAAYSKPDGRAPLVGDVDEGRVQRLGPDRLNDHRELLALGAVLFDRPDFSRAAGEFREDAFWLLGPRGAATFAAITPSPDRPSGVRAFPDGGFFVLESPRVHLFLDCGPVGMRGRGGHGHNDVLGFELWLDGLNVVTDCGAYVYTASVAWRNQFRSTAAHNVVQVDDEELNRYVTPDDLFRLQDDARPVDVSWHDRADGQYVAGSHTGYDRLSPPVRHTREILLPPSPGVVLCRDTLRGEGGRRLTWRFHLDPAVSATLDGAVVRLRGGATELAFVVLEAPPEARLELATSWVSPAYGRKLATTVIVLTGTTRLPATAVVAFTGKDVVPPTVAHCQEWLRAAAAT